MKSVWSESVNTQNFKRLDGNAETDVLIIGGGMAGILCAYFLHEKGVRYILVEAGEIGGGVTKNTTAKITAQHGLIYSNLIRNAGINIAKLYLEANLQAVSKFKELCKGIDCDFEEKPSYVYSLRSKNIIANEVRALNGLGFDAEFTKDMPLPLKVKGAVKFPAQAQFSPLKFIEHISSGLNIYERTFVKSVSGNIAKTVHGNIKAKKIIVATHFPFINKYGLYFMKLYQHRSYVIALENAPYIDGMYVDEAQNGLSFRNYQNMLLIGGGDHRTGKHGGNWNELRLFARKYYPQANERYFWATQDCMSLDGVPYIGRYSGFAPNIYVASGFNKWGMTSSMVSARILSDMITGTKSKYAKVFAPDRSMLKKQLGENLHETCVNFLTPTPRRCSHLGCALKWNKYEKTWDCPCHGSRFTEDGRLIDNPAKRRISV